LPVSFTEVLVSFNRCELLQYLHRLILASEPCRLPACCSYDSLTCIVELSVCQKCGLVITDVGR